jgi:hypothetical protein
MGAFMYRSYWARGGDLYGSQHLKIFLRLRVAGVFVALLGLGAGVPAPTGPHLDANGWTVFTPSADTRIIYVSNSGGKDSNTGRTPNMAVKTIAKGISLLRSGHPDWLLLKKGDVWTGEVFGYSKMAGRSAAEPMLVSSYGAGSRPLLKTDDSRDGIAIGSLRAPSGDFLAVIGIEFYAYTRDPQNPSHTGPNTAQNGTRFLAPVTWVLIEGCKFTYYSVGIDFDVTSTSGLSLVTIRRNVVADDWDSKAHSQGMYAAGISNLVVEDNVFDHNGWNGSVVGAGDTVYNHNAYIKENITNFVAHNNIFANAASHGLQARSGGDVTDNLFLYNPLGMEFGLVNGSPMTPGGVKGTISSNVFEGGRDIAGNRRGMPLEIGNTKPGGNTTVDHNIFVVDNQRAFPAINLSVGARITNPAEAVGINDLTIEKNVVYRWSSAIGFDPKLIPGGSGIDALNSVTIRNNDFQQTLSGVFVYHASPFDKNREHWSNNRYYGSTNHSSPFRLVNAPTDFVTWQSTIEATAAYHEVTAYPEPDRTVETYNASLGNVPALSAFLAEARKQNMDNWRIEYTANAVNNFIRAGFGMDARSN